MRRLVGQIPWASVSVGVSVASWFGVSSDDIFDRSLVGPSEGSVILSSFALDVAHLVLIAVAVIATFAAGWHILARVGEWSLSRWNAREMNLGILDQAIDEMLLDLRNLDVDSIAVLARADSDKMLPGGPFQLEGLARLANDLRGMLVNIGEEPPDENPLMCGGAQSWYTYLLDAKRSRQANRRIEPMTRLEATLIEACRIVAGAWSGVRRLRGVVLGSRAGRR